MGASIKRKENKSSSQILFYSSASHSFMATSSVDVLGLECSCFAVHPGGTKMYHGLHRQYY